VAADGRCACSRRAANVCRRDARLRRWLRARVRVIAALCCLYAFIHGASRRASSRSRGCRGISLRIALTFTAWVPRSRTRLRTCALLLSAPRTFASSRIAKPKIRKRRNNHRGAGRACLKTVALRARYVVRMPKKSSAIAICAPYCCILLPYGGHAAFCRRRYSAMLCRLPAVSKQAKALLLAYAALPRHRVWHQGMTRAAYQQRKKACNGTWAVVCLRWIGGNEPSGEKHR